MAFYPELSPFCNLEPTNRVSTGSATYLNPLVFLQYANVACTEAVKRHPNVYATSQYLDLRLSKRGMGLVALISQRHFQAALQE